MASIHTDLEDLKLISRCRILIHDFTQGRMREWVMHIPARPNEDPDLVFSEIIERYERTQAENARLRAALKEASKEIETGTGSCPQDIHGWYREEGKYSCEDICKSGIESECWFKYFEYKALKEQTE